MEPKQENGKSQQETNSIISSSENHGNLSTDPNQSSKERRSLDVDGYSRRKKPDGSTRFKSRIVSKGFMQVPGVDYTEKFSPVANNATTRILIALTLAYKDHGWICVTADIEAAFLESNKEIPLYMEWPPGSVY